MQIYEPAMVDENDVVTTGLLTGVRYIKDNRRLVTFLSFSLFGFIPLLPNVVSKEPTISFAWSCGCAFLSLVTLGIVSGYASGRNKRR